MKISTFALSSLALACFAASSPAKAEDEWVDVYGKIMLTIDKVDEDNGDDQWEVNSNASRFGVKGKGAAGDLEAFYQMEWEVDMADNSKSSSDHIKARNQIVGLRGGFGEVFLGRHDTPTKKLQNKIDIFGDLSGDIKHTFNGEVRADNIIQYGTPEMNGFNAKVAFIPGEDTGTNDGLADGTSVSLEYKASDLILGVSFDSDVEGDAIDTTRIVAQYKINSWQLGFMYQDTDNDGVSGDGLMGSVAYKTGDNTFKLQLLESDAWETAVSSKVKYTSQTSIGWDRALGKKTTFISYLTLSEDGGSGDKDSVLGVGIVQKF